MKNLGQKNGKMLLGILTMSRYDEGQGFFQEVEVKDVPKKILNALSATGGAGTVHENWFKSNTSGETLEKYFVKVANRVKFELKNVDTLQTLNSETDFLKGVELISKALNRDESTLNFRFNRWFHDYQEKDSHIECEFSLKVYKNDFIAISHPFENDENFEEYKEFFSGRDTVSITFNFKLDSEYKATHHKELFELEELIASKDYSFEDVANILKSSKGNKWNYSIDENRYFYGNK